jgi:putative two-component system response regulator
MLQVRNHPQAGANLLQNVLTEVPGGRVIELAREVALTHHENFDGSGYPQGLAGTNIPLAGRITAVADRYLALTSPRPWRTAFPHAEATDMVRREAGSRFDPQVVEVFLQVAENFRHAETR